MHHFRHPAWSLVFVLMPSLMCPSLALAQQGTPQLVGVLDTTDYLSYTGFQPDIHLFSPCSQGSSSGGVGGVFTGGKTQGGNTVTASIDYVTHGLANGNPMNAYSTGGLAIYALAPPNTSITLTGKRTGSTTVSSSGATVSASTPLFQHRASLPGGPPSVSISDDLFPNGSGVFATGAVSDSCPGYSYVTFIDLSTFLTVNNNCPGTTCGTAEAINSVSITASSKVPAPTNLQASQIGHTGTQIQLTWDYGSDPIDGFKVERQAPQQRIANTWESLSSVTTSVATPGHWYAIDTSVVRQAD
jgi:hypothetical protein